MEIKKHARRFLSSFTLGIVATLLFVNFSYAASGSISVIPASGTYDKGQTFTVAIKIDGGGTKFNAAKSNVAVSQNLTVDSVTLGNCDFALVNTPTVGSLSFAGVILGGSTDSCTIYTMNLKATSGGTGFVFLSDGSIKSYKGATEILQNLNNSSYVFNQPEGSTNQNSTVAAPTPTQPPITLANGTKLYTLVYNIDTVSKNNQPNMKVTLDPGTPNEMLSTPTQSKEDPTVYSAIFENVPQGVHALTVFEGENPVSKQVVNIAGTNREITVGVTPKEAGAGSLVMWIILAVGLVVAITTGIFAYLVIWKKRHPATL